MKQNSMFRRSVIVVTLLMTLFPGSAIASGRKEAFTGVIVGHVNVRMADAIVDLVHISHENGSVWAVAGFLYCCDSHGLVYVSNGDWRSSAAVAESVGKTVLIYPYKDENPHIQHLEELFGSARYLFWKIRILEIGRGCARSALASQIFADRKLNNILNSYEGDYYDDQFE